MAENTDPYLALVQLDKIKKTNEHLKILEEMSNEVFSDSSSIHILQIFPESVSII